MAEFNGALKSIVTVLTTVAGTLIVAGILGAFSVAGQVRDLKKDVAVLQTIVSRLESKVDALVERQVKRQLETASSK